MAANLRAVKTDDGRLDAGATVARAQPMVAAGITDFGLLVTLPPGRAEATDVLGALVAAFRAAG